MSFRICYQAYWYVAKYRFLLNGFMKRSYLDTPDSLETVGVVVKLQEKSHQRCLLICHLCCYLHSTRKIKSILRICEFARISWIGIGKTLQSILCWYDMDCLLYQQLESILKIINIYIPASVTLQKIFFLTRLFLQ